MRYLSDNRTNAQRAAARCVYLPSPSFLAAYVHSADNRAERLAHRIARIAPRFFMRERPGVLLSDACRVVTYAQHYLTPYASALLILIFTGGSLFFALLALIFALVH